MSDPRVAEHVHDRRLARAERALERRADLGGARDVLAVTADRFEHAVVAKVRQHIEGIDVVVAENRVASFDPALLESVGIDPARKSIIALKGGIVARSAYGPLVKQVISFESPGWATCDYRSLPYRHVQRPIFPLDEDVPFSPSARPL